MKKIKIDLKIMVLIVAIALIIALGIFLSNTINKDKIKKTNYMQVQTQIKIETVDENNESAQYVITVVDDSKVAKVTASFLQNETYIIDDEVFYEEGGRYKTFKIENSYRNLYSIMSDINLEEPIIEENQTKNYNPLVEKEIINVLLESLSIDKTTTRDEHAYIIIEDDHFKDFNIYLIDLAGYKGVNITISFKKLDSSYEIETPVFYKDIIDKVNESRFKILN